MAGCHSFCLFFIFCITYIHSITFIQYIYPSPFAGASLHLLIACKLSGRNLLVVPSRESKSGLPYSKQTRYHTEPCRTINKMGSSKTESKTLLWCRVVCKGRERNPSPCRGCVTLWRQICPTPLPYPTLLVSCEIADSQPNQTICPRRNCCQVLTGDYRPILHKFQPQGEKSALYTHSKCTQYTFLAGSFWVLQWPPIRKSPITFPSTPSSSLYISVDACV